MGRVEKFPIEKEEGRLISVNYRKEKSDWNEYIFS